jgi:hypothetical protein
MLVSQWWSGQNKSYGLAGFASTIGLFIFSFWWFKNEPHSLIAQVLPWGPLALVYICGIQVVRRHFGWGLPVVVERILARESRMPAPSVLSIFPGESKKAMARAASALASSAERLACVSTQSP